MSPNCYTHRHLLSPLDRLQPFWAAFLRSRFAMRLMALCCLVSMPPMLVSALPRAMQPTGGPPLSGAVPDRDDVSGPRVHTQLTADMPASIAKSKLEECGDWCAEDGAQLQEGDEHCGWDGCTGCKGCAEGLAASAAPAESDRDGHASSERVTKEKQQQGQGQQHQQQQQRQQQQQGSPRVRGPAGGSSLYGGALEPPQYSSDVEPSRGSARPHATSTRGEVETART